MGEKILVIKHGALGDVVLAQGPFQAIRAHHPDAQITLLTTKLFEGFLGASGLFDDVWVDQKPKAWNLPAIMGLASKLKSGKFDRVYDLQTSSRTAKYFKLMGANKPEWSGIASGCSHPHTNKERGNLHTLERQAEQLREAGLTEFPDPDFTWAINAGVTHSVPEKFALLVPGGSAHRPEKRWPAEKYAEIANILADQGITPVLLGGSAEADVLEVILDACPESISLSGKTSLEDLATLGSAAKLAIGNDTGPLHMIAAVGCPVTVLFSSASDPNRARPRGADVTVLRENDLSTLPVQTVLKTLKL